MLKTSKLFQASILVIFGFASKDIYAYQTPPSDPLPNAVINNAIQKATGARIIEPGFSISDDCVYKLSKSKFQKFSRFCNDPKDTKDQNDHPEAVSAERHPIWDILPPLNELLKEEMTANFAMNFVPPRAFRPRVKLGRDDMPTEYWFDNRIHTFGNTGFFGGMHASVAPFATWLIDSKAYGGIDVRKLVSEILRQRFSKARTRIADLGCGVGMSTRALASAFHEAEVICGIDTSPEMIAMAKFISKYLAVLNTAQTKNEMNETNKMYWFTSIIRSVENVRQAFYDSYNNHSNIVYAIGNAERIKVPKNTFDLVTIMYAFHEIPTDARYRILRESRRLLKPGGILAVIDINPNDYIPSRTMLSGEPYVLEYQQKIQKQLKKISGFKNFSEKDIIPGHVTMWMLERNDKEFTPTSPH